MAKELEEKNVQPVEVPKTKKKAEAKRFVLKKFKLHANICGHVKGTIVPLRCFGASGMPVDREWRKRLHDASIDGCMTVVK